MTLKKVFQLQHNYKISWFRWNLNTFAIINFAVGILWAPFPLWKTLRSFALTRLREEGFGKSAVEPKIMSEIDVFIGQFITPAIGKPVSIHPCNLQVFLQPDIWNDFKHADGLWGPAATVFFGEYGWCHRSYKVILYNDKLAHTEQLVTQHQTRKEVKWGFAGWRKEAYRQTPGYYWHSGRIEGFNWQVSVSLNVSEELGWAGIFR